MTRKIARVLPVLTAGAKVPPEIALAERRTYAYGSSIVTLAVLATVSLLLAPRLPSQPDLWLTWPGSGIQVTVVAGILVLLGLAVVWGFRVLGVRETALVRALMPVTGKEKAVFALLSLVAGLCEEVIFRGFLPAIVLPWVGSYLLAALPAALVFGLLHSYQGPAGMARSAILGFMLATGVAWSGSLWPAIIAHAVLDLLLGIVLSKRLTQSR